MISSSAILSSRLFFLAFGLLISLLSSLDVLDKNSIFWQNDESYFFNLALNSEVVLENTIQLIRYNIFILIIKFYFLIFNNPFIIVILHKILILTIFIY